MNFKKQVPATLLGATLALGGVFVALAPRPATAQGIVTGVISGRVTDASGAAVPNASIKATNLQTGSSFTTTSQGDGFFSIRNVSIGHYRVVVNSTGFSELTVNDTPVSVSNNSNLGDLKLSVASANQSVTVNAEAIQTLTTTEVQSSQTLNTEQLQNLPFNGGFDSVALLSPGVVQTHADNFSNTNGANFSANGNRGRSNNFELDGQSNNDNSIGGPQIFFDNPDALAEVQVITNNFSAQYGRNMGAVVNYLTKSGTNALHGTGFEYYTGSFLSSLTNDQKSSVFGFCAPGQSPSSGCTVPVVPRTVDNRYGGTLGGPIIRDKAWFFGSTFWEHTRDGAAPGSSGSTVTPTPTGLQQLASAFPGNPAVAALQANGPYAVKDGNPKPTSSVIKTVTNGVTSAPIQFGSVQRFVPALFNDQEDLGRIDYQPGSNDHLFIRYFYQNQNTTGPLANSGSVIARGGYVDVPDTAHSVGADLTHTFSPQWVNQLRYSFQQTKLYFQGGAVSTCTNTDLTSCPADVSFGGGFESFGYANNLPQGRTVKQQTVQDNANWTHGTHSVAFGFEWDYQNSPNIFLPDFNGTYNFASFDDYLQGLGTLTLGDGNPVIPFTEPDYAAYFQDDWKVRPDLTLNLGLRYEFFSQAINLLHNETVARETGPTPFWNTSLPLADRTFQNTPNFYKNIEPRLGFAWNPQNILGGTFVLRGGYAINVDPAFYNIFLNAATSAPVINLGTISCGTTHQCLPSGNVTGASVRNVNLGLLPRGADPRARNQTNVAPNFRNPNAQTFTLGIQYGIKRAGALEVRYVGVHTARQFQSLNSNPYLAPVAADFPNVVSPSSLCQDSTAFGYGRLNCNNALVRTRANTAFSIYNGLQMQFRTNQYKGLTGSVSYTFSRTIDNVSEIFSTGTAGTTVAFAQNPLHTNVAERAVSGNDFPNVVAANFSYALPIFNHGNDLKSRILGGWVVDGIYTYNSGQPYNPYQYVASSIGDTSYGDLPFDASFIGADVERPILFNRKAPMQSVAIYVPASEASATLSGTPGFYVYNSFDPTTGLLNQPTSASQAHWLWNNQAAAKLLGNPYPGVPRNTLRGQTWNNLDADIYKNFKVTERATIQLQMTAYNSLNRQYLGSPDSFIEDYTPTGVNSFLSTAYDSSNNRTVQLGAKILF